MAYDEVTAQLVRENEKLRAACADFLGVRDQFAKAAMQGMWASDQPGYECSGKPEALLQRAETAYAQADAMLQVRTRGVASVAPTQPERCQQHGILLCGWCTPGVAASDPTEPKGVA